MNKTLATVIGLAALGLGCARETPVYNPERTIHTPERVVSYEMPASENVNNYSGNPEQLSFSWYTGTDGSSPDEGSANEWVWTRYEPSDSAQCLKKTITGITGAFLGGRFAGWVNLYLEDTACNGSVDVCSGTYEYFVRGRGTQVNVSAEVCQNANSDFASIEEFMNANIVNLEYEVGLWHHKKGVE